MKRPLFNAELKLYIPMRLWRFIVQLACLLLIALPTFAGTNPGWMLVQRTDGTSYMEHPETGERVDLPQGFNWKWSPDGHDLLYFDYAENDTSTTQIFVLNIHALETIQITDTPGRKGWDASWSKLGSYIAWVDDMVGSNRALWVARADGTNARKVVDLPEFASNLDWSWDTEYISIQEQNSITHDPIVHVMGLEQDFVVDIPHAVDASWGSGESRLAYTLQPPEGSSQVHVMRMFGTSYSLDPIIHPALEGTESSAARWSQHWWLLSFLTRPQGSQHWDIALYDFYEIGNETVQFVGVPDEVQVSNMVWSVDGSFLLYRGNRLIDGEPNGSNLYLYDLASATQRQIAKFEEAGDITEMTLSSDSDQVFIEIHQGDSNLNFYNRSAYLVNIATGETERLDDIQDIQWQPR